MKILITGATGFIGKHLIKRLKKEKYNICVLVRPSTDLSLLKKEKIKYHIINDDINNLISFFKKEKFDGVIHLASLFLNQHKPSNINELINSNILFATNILEASIQSEISWFINTGTFYQHFQNKKYSPVNLYAATKQAFEDISKYYIETSNINFVTLKLNDTFGPNDTRNKIFNLWIENSKTKEKLEMSPGQQIIDINYIDNIIDGYIRMISLLSKDKNYKYKGEMFAIKSNERVTLKKLANNFEKITKTKLNINWGGREYRPREVMNPWTKGKNIPGWRPKITIKEGIKKTFKIKKYYAK